MAVLSKRLFDSYCGLVRIRPFRLRQLLDLQFRSICLQLRRATQTKHIRSVLDVGSGRISYQSLFPGSRYRSVDPVASADFSSVAEVPVGDTYDVILLIEVLEHTADPEALLRTLRDRLNPKGELWISVPYSVRIHRAPQDFARWTDTGLRHLLSRSQWTVLDLVSRGGDLSSWSSRLNYWTFTHILKFWYAPLALLSAVSLVPVFLLGAHFSLARQNFNLEGEPLGFFVRAIPD